MKRIRSVVVVVAGTLLGVCGGCADTNSRTVLGGRNAIPAVTPGGGGGLASDAPSVRSLDRSGWGPTLAVVPVDGTVHAPTYSRQRLYDREPARRMGLYPTLESALALDRPGNSLLRVSEILAQPVRAFAEVGFMPVRAVLTPPWSRRQSPMYLYKRQPPGGWLTGGTGPAPLGGDEGVTLDTGTVGGRVEPVTGGRVDTTQGDGAAP